jgi:hypothetical protein
MGLYDVCHCGLTLRVSFKSSQLRLSTVRGVKLNPPPRPLHASLSDMRCLLGEHYWTPAHHHPRPDMQNMRCMQQTSCGLS